MAYVGFDGKLETHMYRPAATHRAIIYPLSDRNSVLPDIDVPLLIFKPLIRVAGYILYVTQWRLVFFKVREEGVHAWLPLACLHC